MQEENRCNYMSSRHIDKPVKPQCCTAVLAAVLRLSWIKTAVVFNAWPDDICGFKWTIRMKNDWVRNSYWHFCCPCVSVSLYFLRTETVNTDQLIVCVCPAASSKVQQWFGFMFHNREQRQVENSRTPIIHPMNTTTTHPLTQTLIHTHTWAHRDDLAYCKQSLL